MSTEDCYFLLTLVLMQMWRKLEIVDTEIKRSAVLASMQKSATAAAALLEAGGEHSSQPHNQHASRIPIRLFKWKMFSQELATRH